MAAMFDDGKDEGALRTIGELESALGIKAHVLRYWEGQFPQLQPLKRSGGRRYYRAEDVALVREIDRLVNREGYTIKGAVAALKGAGARGSGNRTLNDAEFSERSASPSAPAAPHDLVGKLKAVRATLAEALAG